jgi:hypothetical protein
VSAVETPVKTDAALDFALVKLLAPKSYDEGRWRAFIFANPSDQEIRKELSSELGFSGSFDSQYGIIQIVTAPKLALYWGKRASNGIKPTLEGDEFIAKVREVFSGEEAPLPDYNLVPGEDGLTWADLSDEKLSEFGGELYQRSKKDDHAAREMLRLVEAEEDLRERIKELREELPLSPEGTLNAALETYRDQPRLLELVQAEIDRRASEHNHPVIPEHVVYCAQPESPLAPLQPSLFDYSTLDPETATLARHAVTEIRQLYRTSVDCAIKIGAHLIAVERRLFGRYTEWLEAEFAMSIRTAQDFQYIAETFGDVELPDNLPFTAFRILAQPSTPQEAVDEVFNRARSGEQVTVEETKEVVRRVKTTKRKPVQTTIEDIPGAVPEPESATIAEVMAGVCRECGCTEDNACVVMGVPCHWSDEAKTLCSACKPAADLAASLKTHKSANIADSPASNETEKTATSDELSNAQAETTDVDFPVVEQAWAKATIHVGIVLFPDDGHSDGRQAQVSIRAGDHAPKISFVRDGSIAGDVGISTRVQLQLNQMVREMRADLPRLNAEAEAKKASDKPAASTTTSKPAAKKAPAKPASKTTKKGRK